MAGNRSQTDPHRASRQANIDSAIASVRLEGLEPTDAALAIFDRYVDGEISIEEMGAQIRALNARALNVRESRPIPVPGD